MHLHSFFLYYLTSQRPLGYTLAFFALMFEGDITLFSISFLTREGFFDVGDMLIIIFLGVFVGDLLWYYAGKKLVPRYPIVSKWVERFARPFDHQLAKNPMRTLLISKFTYGVHHAILLRTGMHHMNVKQFIKNDAVAALAWIAIIGGFGYFSSLSLEFLRRYLRYAEVSLLVGIIAFFVIEHLIRNLSSKKIQQ